MSQRLYLIETRAKKDYVCPSCHARIPRGARHFRHDPFPAGAFIRGEATTHWCYDCIMSSDPGPKDLTSGRLRVPAVQVKPSSTTQTLGTSLLDVQLELPLMNPLRIELIGIGRLLSEQLRDDISLIYSLSPDELEELICDRLFAMGLEPRRTGAVNRKDGGIDIVFWPRISSFPFLGAAQVKHHRSPQTKEGPSAVREFAGIIASRPINAGVLVTNTSFSPDAEWFAREHAKLIRLRDFNDIRRWLFNDFGDEAEWREMPESIELCPGVTIKIR